MLSKRNDKIKVIKLSRKKGASFCRNLAIRFSNSKYIAFLDIGWEKSTIISYKDKKIDESLRHAYALHLKAMQARVKSGALTLELPEEELLPGQKRLLDVDNPLVLPAGSKVKVLIAGNDVMHSFFVPSLAVQEYSFPGQLNEVWMDVPEREKTYYGQCNQICGINHSYMPIVVKALPLVQYKQWLSKAKLEFARKNHKTDKIQTNLKLAHFQK